MPDLMWYLTEEESELIPESCKASLSGAECEEAVGALFSDADWVDTDQHEFPELRRVMLGLPTAKQELLLRKIIYSAWKNRDWLAKVILQRGVFSEIIPKAYDRFVDFGDRLWSCIANAADQIDECADQFSNLIRDSELTAFKRDLALRAFVDLLVEILPKRKFTAELDLEETVQEELQERSWRTPEVLEQILSRWREAGSERPAVHEDDFFGNLADFIWVESARRVSTSSARR